MTLQKTIENDPQKTIENDLDFGVPKPLKTIKNAKTPKTSILPPLVDLAHRILKEICVCLRRFICFFSPKPYIYIYIYIVYPGTQYPIELYTGRPRNVKIGHFCKNPQKYEWFLGLFNLGFLAVFGVQNRLQNVIFRVVLGFSWKNSPFYRFWRPFYPEKRSKINAPQAPEGPGG